MGIASYYSDKFIGKKTASGERFSQNDLTAACNILPLGTFVIVTNLSNGEKVRVKINDRLNRNTKRIIDLTKEGAKKLDYLKKGITKVKIEVQKK
jgi:rare lipoprotein A